MRNGLEPRLEPSNIDERKKGPEERNPIGAFSSLCEFFGLVGCCAVSTAEVVDQLRGVDWSGVEWSGDDGVSQTVASASSAAAARPSSRRRARPPPPPPSSLHQPCLLSAV